MKNVSSNFSEVKLISIDSFRDLCGHTSVSFDTPIANKLDFHVAQINQNFSIKPYTLRGLYYQEEPHVQTKLVSCLHGSIYSVVEDIRPDSSTFDKYTAGVLTDENQKSMYVHLKTLHMAALLLSRTRSCNGA